MAIGCTLLFALTAGGAYLGARTANWYLHSMVQGPELETAVYPAVGGVVGAALGLGLGLGIAYLMGRNRPD